jgi:hypothetical protein
LQNRWQRFWAACIFRYAGASPEISDFPETPEKSPEYLSYGPPWAHYLGGYQDRLLGGPLGLPNLCRTVPDGVRHKDYGGEVLG